MTSPNRQPIAAQLAAALAEIFRDSGQDVALDAHGMVALAFDDGASITLEAPDGADFAAMHSQVLRVSTSDTATLLRALSLNGFGLPMRNAWLAHDAEGGALILCTTLGAEQMNPDALSGTISGFADIRAEVVRLLMHDGPSAGDPADDLHADSGGAFLRI